jgi:hypothetical protein
MGGKLPIAVDGNRADGSGDWNFAWLNSQIQTTWYDRSFASSPRSSPKDTRRCDWPDEHTAWRANRNSKPGSFEPHPLGLRDKAARAFSPATDTKSASPVLIPKPQRSASRLSRQTPISGPNRIEVAVAWLRAELAGGERPTAQVEAEALCAGIAPRTLDRARKRLGVTSRRIGFGRWAKYVIALPTVHGTPREGANMVGAT